MTIRDKFSKRKRLCMIAFLIGFVLFGGAGSLRDRYHIPFLSVVSAAGFVLGFCSLLYFQRGFRCPTCKKPVSSSGLSFSASTQYCPHCGLDLDSPDAPSASDAG